MTAPLADDGEEITHVLGCAGGRFAKQPDGGLRAV
jgi:hypothetical protein